MDSRGNTKMNKYTIMELIWRTQSGDMSVGKCSEIISEQYDELDLKHFWLGRENEKLKEKLNENNT
jgi:hypothetical protein